MLVFLLKRADYNTKITDIEKKRTDHNHDKYVTIPNFNILAVDVFNARLAQTNLVTKINLDNSASSLDSKIAANKTKVFSNENELKKLKTFYLSYFIGKSHFEENGTQNYLVFQPINRYFKVIANTLYTSSWKSKGLSDQTIHSPATSDNSLTPLIDHLGSKIIIKFTGSCLKQPKLQYTHKTIVNIYIIYEVVPLAQTIMILY